jgi:hypothetical protein
MVSCTSHWAFNSATKGLTVSLPPHGSKYIIYKTKEQIKLNKYLHAAINLPFKGA